MKPPTVGGAKTITTPADVMHMIDEDAKPRHRGLHVYTPRDVDEGDAIADLELKLLQGDDADVFDITDPDTTTGAVTLTFKEAPDFENPADADQDNSYKVKVVAEDDEGLTGRG